MGWESRHPESGSSFESGCTVKKPKIYQRDVFVPPGRSGLFSRVFFYQLVRIWEKMLGQDPRVALRTSLLLGTGGVFLAALFISATPADFLMVLRDEGYEQPSIIYGRNLKGEPVPIAELYNRDRKVIKLDEKQYWSNPPKIVRAFIATEDNNFNIHPGLDLQGILRAAFVNALAGRVKEGASTITQQVSRLRFLSRRRSFVRKAREAFLSLLLEIHLSKREIMEYYLNEVPLGHGAFGAGAAARFYFDKDVFDLNWGEAAVLSSLTTRPADFSPLKDVNESRKKVRVVFRKLIENGDMSIAQADKEFQRLENDYYSVLNRSPNDNTFNRRLNTHPYVTEYIKTLLPSALKAKLYTGGLRIYTTIVTEHQTAAEETFQPYLKELSLKRKRPPFKHFDRFDDDYGDVYPLLGDLFGIPDFRFKITRAQRDFHRAFIQDFRDEAYLLSYLNNVGNLQITIDQHLTHTSDPAEEAELSVEGALVSMRPGSGEITALVGGSGFVSSNQLLRFSMSRRQPGSSFKPLFYGAGIDISGKNPNRENMVTAATLLDDSPVQFVDQDLSEYSPDNYSGSYEGLIPLRRGIYRSKNAVAVRFYEKMGSLTLNPVVESILGLDLEDPPVKLPREASVILGSYAVSPMDMAGAYGVFASGGKEVFPHSLLYVADAKGKVLKDYRPIYEKKGKEARQILAPATAKIMTDILEDVVQKGTGRSARSPGLALAGKTGTTNRNTDAWFSGYSPNLVTVVHIGYDLTKSLGFGGTGGGIAAPIWGRYMRKALADENNENRSFSFPGSTAIPVTICKDTGLLPGPGCSETYTEWFIPGTQPTTVGENVSSDAPVQPLLPLNPGKGEVFGEGDF